MTTDHQLFKWMFKIINGFDYIPTHIEIESDKRILSAAEEMLKFGEKCFNAGRDSVGRNGEVLETFEEFSDNQN